MITPGNHPSNVSYDPRTLSNGSIAIGDNPISGNWVSGNHLGGDVHVYLTTDDGRFITTDDGYRILLEIIPGNTVTILSGGHPTPVTW